MRNAWFSVQRYELEDDNLKGELCAVEGSLWKVKINGISKKTVYKTVETFLRDFFVDSLFGDLLVE